jgi:transposase
MSRDEIRAVHTQGEMAVIELVEGLLKRIQELESRMDGLEGRLSKDSKNSSKPPSGDGFGKRTQSLRGKSQKGSGGQAGHPGQTLEWRDEVDEVICHRVEHCAGCGVSLAGVEIEQEFARQVHEIPAIEMRVTEHRVEVKCCPGCGQSNVGQFPAGVNTVVQYGARLKGVMVYLMDAQLIPSERTVELLQEVLGVAVSEGTLYNVRSQCFEALAEITTTIHQSLLASEVVHFDETGLRVNGQLWWLHVASSSGLTYYFIHPKRGQAAMEAMGILPQYTGRALHDGWKSYAGYLLCTHFLCNAHHLRELRFILERYRQFWAFQMSLLLLTIYVEVQAAQTAGATALSSEQLSTFEARYQAILEEGWQANPPIHHPAETAKPRGRPKQSPPQNLLERLHSQRQQVLGFMYDFAVPFDNNQAERDIRMMKLKQKISGSFRSSQGANIFCRIRGYFSTLRKQEHSVLDALFALFSGQPIPLLAQPE